MGCIVGFLVVVKVGETLGLIVGKAVGSKEAAGERVGAFVGNTLGIVVLVGEIVGCFVGTSDGFNEALGVAVEGITVGIKVGENVVEGKPIAAEINFPTFTDPKPVTGSQPVLQ